MLSFFFFVSLNGNLRRPRKSTRQCRPARLQNGSTRNRTGVCGCISSLWPSRKGCDVIFPSRGERHAWCNPRVHTCQDAKKGVTRKQQRSLAAVRRRRKRWWWRRRWWRDECVPKSTAVHYGDRIHNSSCLASFKWLLRIARR